MEFLVEIGLIVLLSYRCIGFIDRFKTDIFPFQNFINDCSVLGECVYNPDTNFCIPMGISAELYFIKK